MSSLHWVPRLAILALLLSCSLPGVSLAQTEARPVNGVDNGLDPLFLRHRVQLGARLRELDGQEIDHTRHYLFQADYALNANNLLRIEVPYSEPEFTNGDDRSDAGDLQIRYLRRVKDYDGPFDAFGFGLDGIIPTGDLEDRTGGAQWSIAPFLMGSWSPVDGVGIFPSARLVKSLGNDEQHAPRVTELTAKFLVSWSRPHWWAAAEPEGFWNLTSGAHTSFSIHIQFGVLVTRRFAVVVQGGSTLGGSAEGFDQEAQILLRFLP